MKRCLGLALMLLTAACAPNVPLQGSEPISARNVDAPPATARDRIAAALTQRGFDVVRGDDGFLTVKGERRAGDASWALCERALVRDPNTDTRRQRWEDRNALRTVVVARTGRLGAQTNVALDILLVGQYVNSFVNEPFEQRCASSGVLEKALLDAAERG